MPAEFGKAVVIYPTGTGKYLLFCASVEQMKQMMQKIPEWFHGIDPAPHVYSAYSDDPTAS